jgi:regulator of PEP synthase PpsR (kinase-PPPase family)
MSDERVPVELHIVSDSTGETAQRLVLALEAQFPDQPFEEISPSRRYGTRASRTSTTCTSPCSRRAGVRQSWSTR